MNIRDHPHIPHDLFSKAAKHFTAIDNVLSLHFSQAVSPPRLAKILDTASSLCKSRINYASLETLLAFSPKLYRILDNGSGRSGYTITVPDGLSASNLHAELGSRKDDFLTTINAWIDSHQDMHYIPAKSLEHLLETSTFSRSRSASVSPIKKIPLKNDASKFKFKAKNELVEMQKSNGLSLLERIKLKEKLSKEESGRSTPESDYRAYIEGKMAQIYGILFEISGRGFETEGPKNFPLVRLLGLVLDSLEYPLSKDEITDVFRAIEGRLGDRKINIVTSGGVSVVKIFKLDRQKDVEVLKKKN